MKDRLKDLVDEHREEFDIFEPKAELWQNICEELSPAPKEAKVIRFNLGNSASFSASTMFMRVAASIILLLGCGLTILLMKQNTPALENAMAAKEQEMINSIAPEMVEVEAYYVNQIREKKSELSEYDLKILGLDEQQEIDNELARLDSSYLKLKKQLYTTPNTDEIMGAMIQNLQIRIQVLNKQLEILQKIEKMEKPINSEILENNETKDV